MTEKFAHSTQGKFALCGNISPTASCQQEDAQQGFKVRFFSIAAEGEQRRSIYARIRRCKQWR